MDIILNIFIYSMLIVFLFSISITIAFPLFKEYYDKEYEGFFPIYNLFKLCYILELNDFLALLYLIPVINILFMHFIGLKLKEKIETYNLFKIGYIVLPIVFIPLSAYIKLSKNKDKSSKKEKAKEKNKNIEKNEENEEKEKEVEKFDVYVKGELEDELPSINLNDESIFKLRSSSDEPKDVKPYRAKKVKVNEEFINSAPAEKEVIKKVNRNDN